LDPTNQDLESEIQSPSGATNRDAAGAHAALVGVQLMFATLPVAAKYALEVLPPAGLVLFRVLGAAAILFALARTGERRPVRDRGDLLRLALYAVLGVFANQLLFIEGLKRTTAINAQIIATTVPAFTLMFAALRGSDRATPGRVAGIALAAAGAVYLIGPDRLELSPETTAGNAMILGNALAYSLYLVLSKPLLKRYDPITVIAWVFAFGALLVTPVGAAALARSGAGSMTWGIWAVVAFIVLVPTAGSYWLNAWALRRSRPSVVAAYMYLQPLATGVLAVMLLGETPGPRAVPSAALIFVGVALATFTGRRPPDSVDDTLSGR
jgi:drug/metabolite transporter (DMT)-like permease